MIETSTENDRIAVFPMTPIDLLGSLVCFVPFQMHILHSFAAVDKISTDIACCAVPLR